MRKKLFSILALLLTVCGAWAQSNTEDTYIVAGSEPEIFGTSWDGSNQANQMVKGNEGKYSKVYTVDKAYKNVQLKVVKNEDMWIGDETGNNVIFRLTGAGSFTVFFDPDQEVPSVAGDIVEKVNELEFETVYAVGNGNGEDNWLNGADWDPGYAENEMTEVADGVWEITFYDVPEGSNRQVKFALDGAWTHNFGGRFEDFGAQSDAVYNGDNITFDTDDDCDITIQLDLSEFDFDTKEGAKFKINIVYPTDQTDISGATVTGIESSYDWTGNAIEPVPVVTLDGNVLSSETDYDVTYSEGCTDVGSYNVTITGKNNYTGTIVVTFTINNAYFLVGSFSEWQIDPDYKLVANPEAEDEYYINGVELSANDEFKVKSATSDWFPDGMDNAYVITANGTYDIYFRPNYDGGDDWYYNCIYALTTTTSGSCGDNCAYTLYGNGQLVISGTGPMADYANDSDQPWASKWNVIKTIVINDGVTSIGNRAFSNCESATSVSIPASVTSIGNSGFFYCTGISSLTIAENSSLKTIGSSAFYCCSSLKSITIPASVTSIGSSAFDCSLLTTVTLNSNPSIGRESGTVAFPSATAVTMNLTNDPVDGAYWMTFYNENYNFQADANTQVFKAALSGTTLTLTELTTDKIVNKNNAVILKSTEGPIVMTLTTTDSNNDFTGNSLQGVKDPAGVTAADPSTTYVLNYKDGIGVGFYKLTSGKTLGVGKAYLFYTGSNAREFLGFGDTTGINEVRGQKEDVKGEYYDLQGRRVSQPTKGLYIVNGKKVVIK